MSAHTRSSSHQENRPGEKATSKRSTSLLTPQAQVALQQAKCRHGEHLLVTTLTPGERLCTSCAFGTYCPACTPDYLTTHPYRTRARPYECFKHREREAGHA
jgi:hypothetical protein